MFTGLVQAIGSITQIVEHESAIEMELAIGALVAEVHLGDSISIDGVCLTITEINNDKVAVDIMKQTLALTSLKARKVGESVNLELAVLATQRLGGHLVQGHVDGVGSLTVREPGDRWERFIVCLPQNLMKYIVAQGSITVNGVSLTVGDIDDTSSCVELWIIPETLSKTTFGIARPGDLMNIEVDVLGKYVERLLAKGVKS